MIRSWIRISDHFSTSLTIALYGIQEIFSISHTVTNDTRQNDACRQRNESTTFWERSGRHSHPDPEIWIRISDNFWLRFCLWQRFALSEHCQLVIARLLSADTTRPTVTCPGDVRVYTDADKTTVDWQSPQVLFHDHGANHVYDWCRPK